MKGMGKKKNNGFTIVELLVVIVVIAILAAISVVAYTGIQQRTRDSARESDIAAIVKALELYYIDHGQFPPGSGSTVINSSWSTTADASWGNLASHLVPDYISELPRDPISTPGANPQSLGNYNYGYFRDNSGVYCGPARQTYIIVYNLESQPRKNTFIGNCDTTNYSSLGPYSSSNYRVVK
jgi:prepilin-type N-terminal cleavage/methylation domain-containing protein